MNLPPVFKDSRKRTFLNADGADKPLKSPIPQATLDRARDYRKARMVEQVRKNNCAAILMFDPINIRYALDVSSMQVWALHNAFHYALVFADGYAIDFLYRGGEHISGHLRTVNEVRTGKPWFYMYSGDQLEQWVKTWSSEIAACLREHGGNNMRLAVDKLDFPGVDALRADGVQLVEGQALTEQARLIKSADELDLMQWTIRVCEAGMARMYEHLVAGKTEQEIWAELHYENIRSGGEWMETRLLTVGQRTNPWLQECSDNVARRGDMLAFDTDMIGPYGYCADISRSWTIDHVAMTDDQRRLYAAALSQIEHNTALIRPGMDYSEYMEKTWPIPQRYLENRYGCALHGVGLADEYPGVPNAVDPGDLMSGHFEESMVFCVESLIGDEDGPEAVKLETQVVVTSNGARRLDTFPWEEV